jgi:EmrB/QacA subfamily drug resistance transporter
LSILAIEPPKLDSMTARQKSLAFFTLVVALVLEIVDITIVNTALPMIQRDFSGGAAQAQWVVAGYSLSFAILLILGGRLGDIYGYRKMFLLGVTGFTLASIACGLAGNPDELIAARILQGAAGAIMAPQVLALMQILFDPRERIGKLAWFGVIGGLSAIAGPIIGGLVIAADLFGSGWRAVFLINGPIGIAALIAGLRLLPGHERLVPKGIDAVGTVIFGSALALLLYPLIRGERLDWHLQSIASLVAAPLLAWLGWTLIKRRAAAGKSVIFDPELMHNPTFRQGLAIAICFSAANTGFLFIFAYGLQRELGYSPLATGLVHTPFGFGVMFGIGFIGRRFLGKFGKFVLIAGAAVLAVSCAAIFGWMFTGGQNLAILVPALIAGGAGMGMLSGPIPPVTTARVDRAFAGAASGLLKTVQQVGAAIGVALAGSAYFAFFDRGLLAALAVIEALLIACALFAMRLRRDIFPPSAGKQ